MGLRDWLYRPLKRGEPVEVDPDLFVEAQTVMAELDDRGIQAFCTEETIGPDFPARMARITSRVADVDAVRRVIDDVTTLSSTPKPAGRGVAASGGAGLDFFELLVGHHRAQ